MLAITENKNALNDTELTSSPLPVWSCSNLYIISYLIALLSLSFCRLKKKVTKEKTPF